MVFGIYAIKDVYTGYLNPTFEGNDSVARRNFEHAVCRADSLLYSHPNDYDLYRIGTFDSETGVIISCVPELIVGASSIVSKEVSK